MNKKTAHKHRHTDMRDSSVQSFNGLLNKVMYKPKRKKNYKQQFGRWGASDKEETNVKHACFSGLTPSWSPRPTLSDGC